MLNTDMETAWDFFSTPVNLARITPEWLNFKIVSGVPEEMYKGMIVQYNVHPFFGVPVRWVTEITHSEKPHYFIDEQRAGPYRLWHHQHHFRQAGDGVEMTDIVHYILPFDPFSTFLLGKTVKSKLNEIFDFRRDVLEKIFPLK